MARDELLDLVNASAQPAAGLHTVPRALLDQNRLARGSSDDIESLAGDVSPLVVLAIVGVLLAMFFVIVLRT